jgi:hypothetical protein
MKDIIDRIGKRRDEAAEKRRKLIPRMFIISGLCFISIFLPNWTVIVPMIPLIVAFYLTAKAYDFETAKIDSYHEAIDDILAGWRLDLDSLLAVTSAMLPPVEPDREVNDE